MPAVANDGPNNPLDPVHLPEFAATISWGMCRNPACINFGIRTRGIAAARPPGRDCQGAGRPLSMNFAI